MTSALTRLFGLRNLPLVEDVVSDSLVRALEVWKFSGVPDNPSAWLMAAAKNRAIDVLRKERTARKFAPDLEAALSTEWSLVPTVHEVFGDEAVKNEVLRMMFACCHARLAEEVQVALVLNLLSGFGAHEIAQAFLVSDAAMEKRLARGKETLAEQGALPEVTPERVAEGLPSVERALYLLFNEGYHGANSKHAVRVELCAEAIHLTTLLVSEPNVARPATIALGALMCLCAARLPGRFGKDGELVPLEAQDRSLWDMALVNRGLVALEASAVGDELSTYHVEAAIAAEHAYAPSRAETNWPRIVGMYGTLMRIAPSPVVALNRAIAIGESEGPDRALEELAAIENVDRLEDYPFYAAALAEQLLRAGQKSEARVQFERARAKARSPAEERYLDGKIALCGDASVTYSRGMPVRYDLVVIGSGPAGQKAAICAAKLRKRVLVVDRPDRIGGVSVHTGTIPSKTLREAVLYLSGFRQRAFYGKDYRLQDKITVADLAKRVRPVREHEIEVVRAQLKRNDVDTVHGLARFVGANEIDIEIEEDGGRTERVTGERFLVACGTRPAESTSIVLDGDKIWSSDQLAQIQEIPKHLIVVGGGVIGLEYASMLTALGGEVTLIDARKQLLDFVDEEIVDTLTFHMRRHGVTFRLGEKVASCQVDERGGRKVVVANLESGKTVVADALLYAVGRQPNTDKLNLASVGLDTDPRGRLVVNDVFQTKVPHIYAAGDCIGFPALASTSMEQGRIASLHMFGKPQEMARELLPYGIYTIPEISTIGRNEQELTEAKVPYEFGVARYEELAKAQMIGDRIGLLKVLFEPKSLKVLGVHAIGENAAEIIHIGQAVMALGGTVEYFRDTVFNYPTLAEAYKVAALDGLNKLGH